MLDVDWTCHRLRRTWDLGTVSGVIHEVLARVVTSAAVRDVCVGHEYNSFVR